MYIANKYIWPANWEKTRKERKKNQCKNGLASSAR